MGVNLRDLLIFITLSDELTTGYAGLLILTTTLLLFELTELQRRELQRLDIEHCSIVIVKN